MASIRLEAITKDYGGFRAIHGLDLDVKDGSFVAFVGPSGCGKSTLLRMIAGLEEISGGSLFIGERLVNRVEPKDRDVAMVFQDYALYPHKTVRQNIGFGLKMRGMKAGAIAERVDEAANILQIEALLDRRPAQLSGGQRQRVAMGRAIVRQPQVFLFDEPLSNLDAKLRLEMRIQIKRIHQMLGITTIYVTHDQVEAMTLADRVVLLREGVIMQDDAPMEIYSYPKSRFVAEFIGSPTMNILPATVDRAGARPVLRIAGAAVDVGEVPLADGATVDVGIRPEHLTLAAAGTARLAPTLDVLEPLGSDTLAVCMLGDTELTVRLDPNLRLRRGDTVPLDFAGENLHLFDATAGERIVVAPAA